MKIAASMRRDTLHAWQIRDAARNMRGDQVHSERLRIARYVWRLQLHKKSAEALGNDIQRIRDTTGFNYGTKQSKGNW